MIIPSEIRTTATERFKKHVRSEGFQSTTARILYQLLRDHDFNRLTKSFNGCEHATARAIAKVKVGLVEYKMSVQLASITCNKKGFEEAVISKHSDVSVALDIMFGENTDKFYFAKALENKVDQVISSIESKA